MMDSEEVAESLLWSVSCNGSTLDAESDACFQLNAGTVESCRLRSQLLYRDPEMETTMEEVVLC